MKAIRFIAVLSTNLGNLLSRLHSPDHTACCGSSLACKCFKAKPQHLCQRTAPSEASVSFFMPDISVNFVLYSSSQSSTSCGAQLTFASGQDTDTHLPGMPWGDLKAQYNLREEAYCNHGRSSTGGGRTSLLASAEGAARKAGGACSTCSGFLRYSISAEVAAASLRSITCAGSQLCW